MILSFYRKPPWPVFGGFRTIHHLRTTRYINMMMHFNNEVFQTFVLTNNTHFGFLTERITWISSKCISTILMRSSLERFMFRQHSLGNLDWTSRLNIFQRRDQKSPHNQKTWHMKIRMLLQNEFNPSNAEQPATFIVAAPFPSHEFHYFCPSSTLDLFGVGW